MAHIKIKNGLDIPIKGKPSGEVRPLDKPPWVALNLSSFDDTKFRMLARRGDTVRIGQPIAQDKAVPERMFVSPGSGKIKETRRGLKRRVLEVVVELDTKEEYEELGGINIQTADKESIIAKLLQGGLFASIRMRPCSVLANPSHTPSRIFVKAIESAPFAPSAEMQIKGHEKEFQAGLLALSKLTSGAVHLVYRKGTDCDAFVNAENVEKHTAEGPHPVANHSVHIHHIDPIEKNNEVVWTVTAYDVVCIGVLLTTGRVHTDRVISIAGTGILPEMRGYYKARAGYPVEKLIDTRNAQGILRHVSGDLLTGDKVEVEGSLGFQHNTFCSILENNQREFLHFFRLGLGKFSASKAYLSGFLNSKSKEYEFTTNQHGEERAFVDGRIYDKVMPLQISTMHLVKAILADDFDLAEELGILEVDSEDFALPTFVCPCKVEMSDILKSALKDYAKEIIH